MFILSDTTDWGKHYWPGRNTKSSKHIGLRKKCDAQTINNPQNLTYKWRKKYCNITTVDRYVITVKMLMQYDQQ